MKEKANYGNWVPEKALYMLFGVAALTIRCAKAFPKAQITAMDYWGGRMELCKRAM